MLALGFIWEDCGIVCVVRQDGCIVGVVGSNVRRSLA
jgi:hypothetical protein